MTAPIVWELNRKPMTEAHIRLMQEVRSDGDNHLTPFRALASGDLWQREAERDVQVHGEPNPTDPAGPAISAFSLAELIERRRPAMRARREARS